MTAKLELKKSSLAKLYKERYPKNSDEVERKLVPVLENIISNEMLLDDLEFFVIVHYIFQAFKTYEEKCDFMRELLENWKSLEEHTDPMDMNIKISGGIVYDANTVDLRIIKTMNQYMDLLNEIETIDIKLFYRGHSKVSYKLEPSIYRNETWILNEKKMYQELQISCPDNFHGMKSHIEILAEMQHYGLPTRLLDVTQNPLVALYFACENQEAYAGEVILFGENKEDIKYPQSDTIAILASLPAFTYEEQKQFYDYSIDKLLTQNIFNKKAERLICEIRKEYPGFKEEIRQEDLRECLFCIPTKSNKRIDKQEGAFIVCGLLDEKYSTKKCNSISALRVRNSENKKIVCIVEQKEKWLRLLNTLGINKSKIYPEIDDVADYIKNHINEI